MKRQIHPAGRYLSVLAICLVALLGSSAVVQADFTKTNQFAVVQASTSLRLKPTNLILLKPLLHGPNGRPKVVPVKTTLMTAVMYM